MNDSYRKLNDCKVNPVALSLVHRITKSLFCGVAIFQVFPSCSNLRFWNCLVLIFLRSLKLNWHCQANRFVKLKKTPETRLNEVHSFVTAQEELEHQWAVQCFTAIRISLRNHWLSYLSLFQVTTKAVMHGRIWNVHETKPQKLQNYYVRTFCTQRFTFTACYSWFFYVMFLL